MTAIPCGQKNKNTPASQNQRVMGPAPATTGTTFRLTTATTKSRTKSQRPRTRRRWGAPFELDWVSVTASLGVGR